MSKTIKEQIKDIKREIQIASAMLTAIEASKNAIERQLSKLNDIVIDLSMQIGE